MFEAARMQSQVSLYCATCPPRNPSRPSTLQGALQQQAPHWLRLSELLGASGRPRRLIGSTPQQALRHKKGRLQPEMGLRHFWEGASASLFRLRAPTNNPIQCAIANEMEENTVLVMSSGGPQSSCGVIVKDS